MWGIFKLTKSPKTTRIQGLPCLWRGAGTVFAVYVVLGSPPPPSSPNHPSQLSFFPVVIFSFPDSGWEFPLHAGISLKSVTLANSEINWDPVQGPRTVWPQLQFVCWWVSWCPKNTSSVSRMDLLWQLYVLPHWDRSCRSHLTISPTVNQTSQSERWPCNNRHLAG